RGDAADAEKRRAASGCVREALVLGPMTWAAVTGVDDPDPLDAADAPIAAAYAIAGAFRAEARPLYARAQGCTIALSQESWRPGVRDVVADVEVPRAQTIGLVLRARASAVLRAGGVVVARRPFELGDGEAARFVRVAATAGTLRLVARVGTAKEDDVVEIDAFDDAGAPLRAHAPAVGPAPSARATVTPIPDPVAPPPSSDLVARGDETLLTAASAIAAGSPRETERMLWGIANRADARPDLALVYGRSVETALDLSAATRAERARSAYERVLEAWPASWEATLAHAVLAGARRGREEAGIEALRDLDTSRAKGTGPTGPAAALLDAFEAITSGDARLFDRAHAALDRGKAVLAGTALFADALDASTPEVGTDRVATACDPGRASAKDTLACLDALRDTGDRAAEWHELARLRALLAAPDKWLAIELRDGAADYTIASRAFAAMSPAERTMNGLAMLTANATGVAGASTGRISGLPAPWLDAPEARARLMQLATTARDAPGSIAPLLRAEGDDPTADLDATAEKLAAADRAQPLMPNAATAVLAHQERYEIGKDGLLHWQLFDVRRVSGTTDVEENAQAGGPGIWGRATVRAVRRRILKRDGSILEPDRTPRASQEHADLSQLEQGDAVEAIYEGWASPGDTGDLGIDTPDLLPDRVAVKDATIELRTPVDVRAATWSHPLLGKPAVGDIGGVRFQIWHLADQPARRVEDGVPKMDRNVGISFSTTAWSTVARALRESVAALDEHDPEIAAWARDAAGTAAGKTTRDTVNAIVIAAGKALREGDSGALSDFGGGIAPVQAETARTSLASHDGSRSWLILRSLRELGIPCDLVVAENDPFSADPNYPVHFGRFLHPLLVAHLPASAADAAAPTNAAAGTAPPPREDVWIDADVAGPPLPAGRVSPELRGRLALHADGTIAPLPAFGAREDERDEIDIRLAVDPQGDARGTFAVVLRGRGAQEIAEALFRTVGAERQRALRDVVLAWLPWANVDDVQLASNEGSWQVSLRADISVDGYAQVQGPPASPGKPAPRTGLLPGLETLHWVWPRARVSSLAASFAARAGRESALAVGAAVQYHVHRRVDLPKGVTVARMPGPLDVKTKLLDASRKMTVSGDGGTVEDDFVLDLATGTIPPAEYDAFVAGAHAADDGFLATVRVTMPAIAGPTGGAGSTNPSATPAPPSGATP
ncbi:MAG TPA: hypothetical protein VHV30_15970, partial [Polyangiaceae bacterium]|nr:hypothetical protein [Polyangiaceae bacterium]